MIITFSVQNWRSFKDKATLNMTASLERQHRERLPFIKKFNFRLLPISAIYGANASGKTKFVEALAFLQDFLFRGTLNQDEQIAIQRFKLDNDMLNKPSRFSIDLLIDEQIYSYEIALLPEKVIEEKLIVENSSTSHQLFHRLEQEVEFDASFFKDDQINFLNFIFKATRKNQLFLTNAVHLNADVFLPFYNWMKNQLVIIRPTSIFSPIQRFADPADLLSGHAVNLMRKLDTGIDHFSKARLHDVNKLPLSSEFIEAAKKFLPSKKNALRIKDTILWMENGELVIEKLFSVHKDRHGRDVAFLLEDESDGTLRLLDLLPAFANLHDKHNYVFIIDELDRSLHTLLQEWLIKFFLESCGENTRNQLIFTTHNVNLLNQSIFRRDELWGISKNGKQCSELYSFRDFEGIRKDKDIRKIYLNGLIGAVPFIN